MSSFDRRDFELGAATKNNEGIDMGMIMVIMIFFITIIARCYPNDW